MVSRNKLIVAVVILIVIAGALVTLVRVGNKILKGQFEKSLGDNVKVAEIGLSWGRVEAREVQVLRDGKIIAAVKKLGLKPDLLTIFRKRIGISVLTIEEPVIQLEIDKDGTFLLPSFPQEEATARKRADAGTRPASSAFAIDVKQIDITNGKLLLIDHRLKELNEIEASRINARFDNLHIPLTDDVSKVKLGMTLSGKLISGSVAIDGSIDLMRMGFNVAVEANNLAIANLPGSGPQARMETVTFHASSQGKDAKLVEVSEVNLQKLYVRAQTNKEGKLINPLSNVLQVETGPAPGEPVGKTKPEPASQPTQVNVKGLKISQGEVLILDGKVSTPPYPLRLTDVSLNADQFASPPQDTFTTYECSVSIPGKESTGVLRASGKTKLKSLDTASTVSLHGLDITTVKPYILKAGDVNVTQGTIDLDLNLRIDHRNLDSPAKVVLKNLRFAPSNSAGEKFMAIPRGVVVEFLKANNNQIALDFVVNGSIDDPKFSLRETLMTRFAVQLADKLGLGAISAGQKLIETEQRGLKNLGESLKETSKSLRKLFSK